MMISFIIYCLLTFSAGLFHLFGTYYFLYSTNNLPFVYMLLTSIIINVMATIIRVPANMFLGQGLSVVYMEMLYVFLLFIAMTIYSLLIIKETLPVHTYIIAGLMFGLFMLNDYLSKNTIKNLQ